MIRLPARLDRDATARLAAELSTQRGQSLRLDADAVAFVGALAAQLLVVACRQWREDGMEFSVESASDAFVEGLALLGIDGREVGAHVEGEAMQ